jgi:NAD(P)-dependent dehydrogenase (short-subunit alcohol dehydrogenase family)
MLRKPSQKPIGAVAQHVDVSRDGSVAEMIGAAQALWGRIDILVNNAGVTHLPQAMDHVSEEEFDQVFAVNAKSCVLDRSPSCSAAQAPKVWRHLEHCLDRRAFRPDQI